jgi:hypothetical protein
MNVLFFEFRLALMASMGYSRRVGESGKGIWAYSPGSFETYSPTELKLGLPFSQQGPSGGKRGADNYNPGECAVVLEELW